MMELIDKMNESVMYFLVFHGYYETCAKRKL